MAVSQPCYYIRSPLARAVYSRIIEDQSEQSCNHSYWYSVNLEHFSSDLKTKFLQLGKDNETQRFLKDCGEKSDWLFTQIFHSLVKFILSWVMNKTSINGLLKRGSMFIFSQDHFSSLMEIDSHQKRDRLLDLGAGDGMITRQMASFFNEVFVTEMSATMKWRLNEHGFKLLDTEEWFSDTQEKYDVISCLNLLDRCERPIEILEHIRSMLKPGSGRLLLAIVLPFSPYVEFGVGNHQMQHLNICGKTFEEQVQSLTKNVLEPLGYVLERFSRLPYLCEGDLHHSFYYLSDAVFVLSLK